MKLAIYQRDGEMERAQQTPANSRHFGETIYCKTNDHLAKRAALLLLWPCTALSVCIKFWDRGSLFLLWLALDWYWWSVGGRTRPGSVQTLCHFQFSRNFLPVCARIATGGLGPKPFLFQQCHQFFPLTLLWRTNKIGPVQAFDTRPDEAVFLWTMCHQDQ